MHKLTTRLADSYGIIGVETLNLKGLLKNRRLARSFSDASLGTFERLLETKVAERGGQVIKVDRFFVRRYAYDVQVGVAQHHWNKDG